MEDKALIEATLAEHSGQPFEIVTLQSLGGGCINDAFRASDGHFDYFIKANRKSYLKAFENEAQALREIAAASAVRVPEPIATLQGQSQAYLILEYIASRPSRVGDWDALGAQLAALHQIEQPYFGWDRDNLIGATPQPNPATDNWIDFFRVHRLQHLLTLCRDKGFVLNEGDALLERMPDYFAGHQPRPALLHGDLWSGNVAFDNQGAPFLFDPASYYGDRETDIAFTEFFGGFGDAFYRAYQEALPLDPGYELRKILYNLYHCLNHVYLFGGSYANQAQMMAKQLLAS